MKPELVNRVKALHARGVRPASIAAMLEIPYAAVRAILRGLKLL